MKQHCTGIKTDILTTGTGFERPGINSWIDGQFVFRKVAKNTYCRKDNPFNKWCWGNWIATYKRMKLDLYFTPSAKINSKWIKKLNV